MISWIRLRQSWADCAARANDAGFVVALPSKLKLVSFSFGTFLASFAAMMVVYRAVTGTV